MRVGVQFDGQVPARSSRRWFTHSWPANWHVLWNVVPKTPLRGGKVEWDVEVERQSSSRITYWITIRNESRIAMNVEARYAVMN